MNNDLSLHFPPYVLTIITFQISRQNGEYFYSFCKAFLSKVLNSVLKIGCDLKKI